MAQHGQETSRTDTVFANVTLGERYQAGAIRSLLFGKRYRDLWATPIDIEVLDLSTYAGGLTPIRRSGSGQTQSLRFVGADGRQYVIRSVDKTLHVPDDFEDTFVASVMQDMKIHAFHPAAALVVAPLLAEAGVLHADPTLVVLPDDPRLGEFREEFAGLVGFIEERPNETGEDAPGFAGSTKIVGTDALLERVEDSEQNRVDAVAYLRARLIDMWLGDRDRHVDQWRWAGFTADADTTFEPIPRDRDEAFVANDGVAWWAVQRFLPRFTGFHESYPDIAGLTENGWDLDRLLLGGVDRQAWDSTVAQIQRALTDSVIDNAVRRMPSAMYERNGAELARALETRRNHLPEAAAEFYALIATEVDVYGTDADEIAEIDRTDDGHVEVTIRPRGESPEHRADLPYFHRRFDPDDTKEVRLYLRGGADSVVVRGTRSDAITLRIIGGGGDDWLIDRADRDGGGVHFYDSRGENHLVTGRNATLDTHRYRRPRPSGVGPHEFVLDWGHVQVPVPVMRANYHGLIVGAGLLRQNYGFRKNPYRSRIMLQAAVSTDLRVMFEFESRFAQIIGPNVDASFHAWVSGVEPTAFFGFGNDTQGQSGSTFYRVDQYQAIIDPTLALFTRHRAKITAGPVFKYTNTRNAPGQIAMDTVYGAGNFSQLGAQVGFEWDARSQYGEMPRELLLQRRWTSGLNLKARSSIYPALLDVEDAFGEATVELASYLTFPIPLQPTVAVQMGAKKVWGEDDVPYYEAAFVGGGSSLRAFSNYRFAGDAALYGNVELGVTLARFNFLFPTEFGVFGLADAGRVYLDRASPGGWHTSGGGGIWFAPMKRAYTVSVAVASSTEQTSIYFSGGFVF